MEGARLQLLVFRPCSPIFSFLKTPRGSILNNGEVQLLLEIWEGETKNIVQFKKFFKKQNFPFKKPRSSIKIPKQINVYKKTWISSVPKK